MTLTENTDDNLITQRKEMEVSFAFKEALCQAARDGRVTCGAYQCAKQIQGYPERFLYCIFPDEDNNDDMSNIEHILMEAYCREHRIKIIRVDSSKKLGKLLSHFEKKKKNSEKTNNFSCVLVEKAKGTPSVEESRFLDVYRTGRMDSSWQVIEVPS